MWALPNSCSYPADYDPALWHLNRGTKQETEASQGGDLEEEAHTQGKIATAARGSGTIVLLGLPPERDSFPLEIKLFLLKKAGEGPER